MNINSKLGNDDALVVPGRADPRTGEPGEARRSGPLAGRAATGWLTKFPQSSKEAVTVRPGAAARWHCLGVARREGCLLVAHGGAGRDVTSGVRWLANFRDAPTDGWSGRPPNRALCSRGRPSCRRPD